jgi:hypothetical protein
MFWLTWQLLGVLVVIVAILIAVNILTALWDWWHGRSDTLDLIAFIAVAVSIALAIGFATHSHW